MSTGDSHQDDRPTTGDQTVPLPVTPADDGVAPPQDGSHVGGGHRGGRRGAGADPADPLVGAGIVALLLVVALVVWLATRGDEPTTTTPGPARRRRSRRPRLRTTNGSAPTETRGHRHRPGDRAGTTATDDPDEPVPTTIPADLLLPAEGEEGWTPPVDATSRAGPRSPRPAPPTSAGSPSGRRRRSPRTRACWCSRPPTPRSRSWGRCRRPPGLRGTGRPALGHRGGPLGDRGRLGRVADGGAVLPRTRGRLHPRRRLLLRVRAGSAVAVSGGYGEWAPGYPDPDPSRWPSTAPPWTARAAALRLHRGRLLTRHPRECGLSRRRCRTTRCCARAAGRRTRGRSGSRCGAAGPHRVGVVVVTALDRVDQATRPRRPAGRS